LQLSLRCMLRALRFNLQRCQLFFKRSGRLTSSSQLGFQA
jgi:hypothetical protein